MSYTQEELDAIKNTQPHLYELLSSINADENNQNEEGDEGDNNTNPDTNPEPEPEPDLEPEPEPANDDAKPDLSGEKPTGKDEGDPQEEVKDFNYWQKKADEQAAKKPEPKESKPEDSKLREENKQLSSQVQSLQEQLKELTELVKKGHHESKNTIDDSDEVDELSDYPTIRRMKDQNQALRNEIDKLKEELSNSISPMKDRVAKAEEHFEREKMNAFYASHESSVASVHPDFHDYFAEDKKGKAFAAWTASLPNYKQKVMSDPYSYDPVDVADIITEFKTTVEKKSNTQPKSGDFVKKVKGAPVSSSAKSEIMSRDEMRDYGNLLYKAMMKGQAEVDKLNKRYEQAVQHYTENE